MVGQMCGAFEISLLLSSFVLLKRGIQGLSLIILILQYLMFRVSVDPYVSVCIAVGSNIQRSLQSYDMSLNQLVYHPRCPLFIRKYNHISQAKGEFI